jgi:hypothetical protein
MSWRVRIRNGKALVGHSAPDLDTALTIVSLLLSAEVAVESIEGPDDFRIDGEALCLLCSDRNRFDIRSRSA